MTYKYQEVKQVVIKPSDVYQYQVLDAFLAKNHYELVAFRPPKVNEFWLEESKNGCFFIRESTTNFKDELPRFIVRTKSANLTVGDLWE